MKSFKAYLTESTKTYDFRLRIAGELTTEMINKMKVGLERFQLDSISKPKRLPIQETPEFPNMGPVEVNIVDISLHYPTNDAGVRVAVAETLNIDSATVKVTPVNSPYEAVQDGKEVSNKDGKPGESVLLQDEMVTEKADDLVGEKRLPFIMKELDETRPYTIPKAEGHAATADKTTNDIPVGELSPIGTHKNKIPDVRKMKAGNGK
jgi:hypothetical protein